MHQENICEATAGGAQYCETWELSDKLPGT